MQIPTTKSLVYIDAYAPAAGERVLDITAAQRNQLEVLAEPSRADTEAKLRFFTNFSHELRTPLTLIMGPVEELLTSGPVLTEGQRQDLTLVRRNTQRLLQLVNQLLDFRKIEVGKMAVRATQGDGVVRREFAG